MLAPTVHANGDSPDIRIAIDRGQCNVLYLKGPAAHLLQVVHSAMFYASIGNGPPVIIKILSSDPAYSDGELPVTITR